MNALTSNSIVVPGHITRQFVQTHPELIFCYGIDMQCSSAEGQPFSFAGYNNAFPIPVMERYCPSQKIYFNDSLFTHYANIMDDAIDKIAQQSFMSKRPVIVCPKIGRGCSRLQELAPKLYNYLTKRLDLIKYPDVKWIY